MALWGNKDRTDDDSGTIAIATNGAVTGTDTLFTTEAKIGNTIRADGRDYVITAITSDTACTVQSGINGGSITAVTSGTSYTFSEKPVFVSQSESASSSGDAGDSNKVFGVDTNDNNGENYASSGRIVEVGVANPGTGYIETPNVTFSGGGGSSAAATATVSGGSITAITLTNNGSSYENVPSVFVDIPRRSFATGDVNITTDAFTYSEAHGMPAGEQLTYRDAGGTAIAGLTDDAVYYVSALGLTSTAFRLATSSAASALRTALSTLAISGTGGQFTCAATTLAVGDRVVITGTLTGTGTITGYSTGNIYRVSAVTGTSPSVTGFTLTTEAADAIVTTAGTTVGLTARAATIINLTGTGNDDQFFDLTGAVTATAVANLGGGNEEGESRGNIAHAGWVRRTTGTGGRAGRVHYETLVAMGSIDGDQSDDRQFPDD
jgi:hypothetical protein